MLLRYPDSLTEARECLADGAIPIGGGTLLQPRWQQEGFPELAFSLSGLADATVQGPDRIGAAVTLDRITDEAPEALVLAAANVGHDALRSQATVGGNLAGDGPRCLLPALLVLGASALVLTGEGLGETGLAQALTERHLLVSLHWTPPAASDYRKIRAKDTGAPVLAVATAVPAGPDGCAAVRVAVWRDREIHCESVNARNGADWALLGTGLEAFGPDVLDVVRAGIAASVEKAESN